jgi:hypothetical protein
VRTTKKLIGSYRVTVFNLSPIITINQWKTMDSPESLWHQINVESSYGVKTPEQAHPYFPIACPALMEPVMR